MAFKVNFVNGESTQFEGSVDLLSAQRRTAVGGMVELKQVNTKATIFVNLDHVVYAMNVK
jgi:hypothetical protein